jgi:outer membrane protein assembly factor BamB
MRLIAVTPLLLLLVLAACTQVGTPEGWSQGVVAGETLYIGTMEGDLVALDINTRRCIWSYELRGEDEKTHAIYGAPAIAGETLYVGGYDGLLYALPLDVEVNETCGDIQDIWKVKVGDGEPIVGGPVVADGLVLVGSSDGMLHAFDATDGTRIWTFPTDNKVWSTPAVADGVVYFGSLDQNLYALNLKDGTEVWPSPFSAGGAIAATPLIANGRVYVGAFDAVFYAVDARTGVEVARFEGASKWYWGGAVATEDMVFAPSLDGNVYALDIDTLERRWTLETEGPIVGSPVIVGDRIVVPSKDDRVRSVRTQDGSDEFFCDAEDDIVASLTVHEGVIYFPARDHSIHALTIGSDGSLSEMWVMFTNDKGPERPPFCL